MGNKIFIKYDNDQIIDKSFKVEKAVKKIFKQLKLKKSELSIYFSNEKKMSELNLQYRNKKGSTDVLSFCQQEGELQGFNSLILGDIIICIETAKKLHKDIKTEFILLKLLIHGVLHLLGYDHIEAEDAEKMNKKEIELFNKIGGKS